MNEMSRELTRPGDPFAVPSPWVRRFAHLVPAGGRVLDLAAGAGRHARFFRERGCAVTALDRNLAGMADLVGRDGIALVEADLEDGSPWALGDQRFDGIVVAKYLNRPLLPRLAEMLAPGGVLIYETYALGQERFGRPATPDFLLRPGELLQHFADRLTVVAYEHGVEYTPNPAAIQRIAAVKGEGAHPL
jgi:SAM-dependent methyltransferase